MMRSLESRFNPAGAAAAAHEFVLSKDPMNRYGRNDEVANLALFLAGGESTFCTSGIHTIDGRFIAA